MKIHRMELLVATAIVALLGSAASAGTIQSVPAPTVSGPGLGFANVAAVITIQPNNDNVPAPGRLDNNVIVPLKRFDKSDYIDIEFSTLASDGVTEYQFSEFVDNNTLLPWISYRMVLGFGTGAAFVTSPNGDGLDFDFPNYDTPPSSGAFPIVATPNENELVFSGGLQSMGAQPYSFRIDVPDLVGRIGGRFTLRQIPNPVPEPSAIVLFATAIFGLVLRRRA